MAAKKQSRITSLPDLVLVTEANRKFCVILGRKMYVYEHSNGQYNLRGEYPIRVRMIEGWLTITDENDFTRQLKVNDTEPMDDYADTFKSVLNKSIKEKELYINPKEKLIQYEYQKPK